MLESRASSTWGHSERVAQLCRSIAQELELSPEGIETLDLAAKFHDIGKLAIPDSVFLKPEPLDLQERSEVESHPRRSVQVLCLLPFLQEALPIIEGHHEAWDGSGYPRGLKGEEIPLGARIMAVANAFDTMTCPHPYRPALSRAEAISHLRAGAGVLWDPGVVEAFLRAIKDTQDTSG